MSARVRYNLATFLCLSSFFAGISGIGMIAYGFIANLHYTKTMNVVVGSVSIVLILTSYILREWVRTERENKEAEAIEQGKGKRFRNMSKQERDILRTQNALKQETLLGSVEYKNIVKKGVKKPDEELEQLIGLKEVKNMILRYKAQICNKKTYKGSKHMCFLGNPGTGKTTVVSILTSYLHKFGYIKKNEYLSVDGNFFKSGEDPIARTRILLNKAKGKVLFIDEAYSIVQGNGSTGQELLAILLNEMENNRDNMIIILAGYKKEMKELFNANSGLSSRIKNYFMFEDYSMDECKQIFTQLIHNENLFIPAETMDCVEAVLYKKRAKENYANARTVRNLAEQCITEHEYNLLEKRHTEKYVLKPEDIVMTDKADEYFA